MKRKYVLVVLVAIVLFLLYSRRVSGLDASSCTPTQHWSTLTASCLDGAAVTMTNTTATNTSVSTNRKVRR